MHLEETMKVDDEKLLKALNNYVKRFKDKSIMLKRNGYYILNPLLSPETDIIEITIQRND